MAAIQQLELPQDATVQEIRMVRPDREVAAKLIIDGSDTSNYHLKEAA